MNEPAAPRLGLLWEVALRYLRGRRSKLLDGTARTAFFSSALGVLAMTVAMALLSGYRGELQRKLVGANAAVIAVSISPATEAPEPARLEALRRLPGVESVQTVSFGQGTFSSLRRADGVTVTVRGVDPGDPLVGDPRARLPAPGAAGPTPLSGASEAGATSLPPVFLGSELAAALRVGDGDAVRWAALGFRDGRPRFTYVTLRVAGSFHTGFSEFDRTWAVAPRGLVEARAGGGGLGRLIEVRAADPNQAPRLALDVRQVLGDEFVATDWQSLNSRLFSALRLQQRMLFLVLGLIVVVSTFNVASTVVVLLRERLREVGVLATLGLDPTDLRRVFLFYGGALGLASTAAGLACGAGLSWALDAFRVIRFDPEVAAIYFIDAVPFRVRLVDLAAVGGFALAANLLACWLPSARASRIVPSAALRYE
jgi:lipoprotein-releasing system permease protein